MDPFTSLNRRTILAGSLLMMARLSQAASPRRHEDEDDERDSIRLSQFLPAGADPRADATPALVAAMKKAVADGKSLHVDGRYSIGFDIVVPGPIKIFGRPGGEDGFDLGPAPASVRGGVHGHLMLDGGKSIEGVHFANLTFRNGYDDKAWTGSRVVPIVRISPRAGNTHRDINFRRCRFMDPANDCLHVAPESGAKVEGLNVVDCEANVTVPLDRSSRVADLVRTILAYQDWQGHKSSYGQVAIQNVHITGCRARGIRTLADLKRGTGNFEVTDCHTEDMMDCHFSCDGAFHGTFARIDGVQRSPLAHAKNFVEIQGEDITVRDFSFVCDFKLGAIAGVLVTQYGLPVEGPVAVHQSKDIHILKGSISGIAHHGVRLLNVDNAEVRDVTVSQLKGAGVAVESPGKGLTPRRIVLDNIVGQGGVSAPVIVAPQARGEVTMGRVQGFGNQPAGNTNPY